MDWIKVMCNILDHRKIKMIRKSPEGNTLVLLWLLLLVESGKCNRGGYLMIANNIPYSEETISMITDIPLSTVRLGLSIFKELGMIDQRDNNTIYISNWTRYQSEDKLEARRRTDRLRQQRYRRKKRNKLLLETSGKMDCDSHVSMSRDVTPENRQEQNREEYTTTEQIRSLVVETPFAQISDRELQSLIERHGLDRVLLVADIAAETWRRNPVERHNPGGYVNSLCSALIVPDWYVPFAERKKLAEESLLKKKEIDEEKAALAEKEKAQTAAKESLWNSLSSEQRKEYLDKVRAGLPAGVSPPKAVLEIMARGLLRDNDSGAVMIKGAPQF